VQNPKAKNRKKYKETKSPISRNKPACRQASLSAWWKNSNAKSGDWKPEIRGWRSTFRTIQPVVSNTYTSTHLTTLYLIPYTTSYLIWLLIPVLKKLFSY